MNSDTEKEYHRGRLVTLKPGMYVSAGPGVTARTHQVELPNESNAILLENQGKSNGATCWHVLVGGNVLMAWEDSFVDGVD